MPIIISFDPGATTGLCILEATSRNDFDILEADEIEWSERFNKTYEVLKEFWRPDDTYIVCEQFLLYGSKANDQVGSKFPSSQMIGIIQAYATLLGADVESDQFKFQNASLIHTSTLQKSYMKATKQPVAKLTIEVREQDKPVFFGIHHALDAYAHARYYIMYNAVKIFVKL